jgi:hypothetical protein
VLRERRGSFLRFGLVELGLGLRRLDGHTYENIIRNNKTRFDSAVASKQAGRHAINGMCLFAQTTTAKRVYETSCLRPYRDGVIDKGDK